MLGNLLEFVLVALSTALSWPLIVLSSWTMPAIVTQVVWSWAGTLYLGALLAGKAFGSGLIRFLIPGGRDDIEPLDLLQAIVVGGVLTALAFPAAWYARTHGLAPLPGSGIWFTPVVGAIAAGIENVVDGATWVLSGGGALDNLGGTLLLVAIAVVVTAIAIPEARTRITTPALDRRLTALVVVLIITGLGLIGASA